MNTLRKAVDDYLALRRSMGFKLEGLSKLLTSYVAFCEKRDIEHVSTDTALEWATSTIKVPVNDALFARRMDAVRIFARYQHALDPATEIPADDVCDRRYQPRAPNVFSTAQVRALMEATTVMPSPFGSVMWRTLIGLLAVTGLRPGEACRLRLEDIDLAGGAARIRDTKFHKSRIVFLHPTTTTAIDDYLRARRAVIPTDRDVAPVVFIGSRHGQLDPNKLGKTFTKIAAASIVPVQGHRSPRLHDLRHTFAVTTLLDWYADGGDIQPRLPLLSTWLGHVDPASTYWYLHAVPELLARAAHRLEAVDQQHNAGEWAR